jgi:2-dehydropantoate 2-reductase
MKVAVVGAGAIGAFVGAALARGGTDTHLIARGPNLAAMRRDGVRVLGARGDWSVRVPCTDDPADIGVVDVVLLGLKAHAYATAGPLVAPLLGPRTAIVAAQNGIPWWYFHRHGGEFDGRRLESVDPGGAVTAVLDPERAVGCVVYPATELEAPGVVRHIEGTRFALGEPDRSVSERCEAIAGALRAGGLKAPVVGDLRRHIWLKLMGNASLNPLSALTGATMAEMCRFPPSRALLRTMMEETLAVATALGAAPELSIDQRLAGAEAVGDHKTSMLQDLEAGRPLELDVLLGAVIELGALTSVPTPALSAIFAATSLLAGRRSGQLVGAQREP